MGCTLNAAGLAGALAARRAGQDWMARCPAHRDREPSLAIRDADDGSVLVRCHAGCPQDAVLEALRNRGLWHERGTSVPPSRPRRLPTASTGDDDERRRTERALSLWNATRPATGTPVERYLLARGISLSVPVTLRFHAGLSHPSGQLWPAMVALVVEGATGTPRGIHRTFLASTRVGKAPVSPNRMMLGACRGGAVRLGEPVQVLMVGEGIETSMSAMQATGLPAWAALSTSGLLALQLPAEVREVIVLADGDEPGEKAALGAGRRWKREGRTVRIARPPDGLDFNDVLRGATARLEGGVS